MNLLCRWSLGGLVGASAVLGAGLTSGDLQTSKATEAGKVVLTSVIEESVEFGALAIGEGPWFLDEVTFHEQLEGLGDVDVEALAEFAKFRFSPVGRDDVIKCEGTDGETCRVAEDGALFSVTNAELDEGRLTVRGTYEGTDHRRSGSFALQLVEVEVEARWNEAEERWLVVGTRLVRVT